MYFMQTARYRDIEELMCQIPNFHPRGHGSVVLKDEMLCTQDQPPPLSYAELLTTTMSAIWDKPFRKRLEQYIKEVEVRHMLYRNENHERIFKETIEKVNQNNAALLSALYLLTADFNLWKRAKPYIRQNRIDFHTIRLNGINEKGYTLFGVAKDLYLGTKYLTVGDLADKELISLDMFRIICNAMAIRRFGMKAVCLAEGGMVCDYSNRTI